MIVHLFGHLEGDFVLRVVLVDSSQTVGALAKQLQAWGPELYPAPTAVVTVRNEDGVVLEPVATLTEAGLLPGDIFSVDGVAP